MSSKINIKVNGAWKEVDKIYVKINGSWTEVDKVFNKQSGSWVEESDKSAMFNSNTVYLKGSI